MSKANTAMGDIDTASSPSSQNSPPDPGKILGSIDLAAHGGTNSTSTAQDVTTTAKTDQSCGAPVWMENKMSVAEQLAFRNKAFHAGQMQNGDPNVPDFQAGEIEY